MIPLNDASGAAKKDMCNGEYDVRMVTIRGFRVRSVYYRNYWRVVAADGVDLTGRRNVYCPSRLVVPRDEVVRRWGRQIKVSPTGLCLITHMDCLRLFKRMPDMTQQRRTVAWLFREEVALGRLP